jgi:hypothetical protein
MQLLKRIPALVFFIGIVGAYIIAVPAFEKRDSVHRILSLMPEEDRLALDAFFRILIFKSSFGYVLYGDKPISLVNYVSEYSDGFYGGIRYSDLSIAHAILREGWLVWKKYQHLFPSRHYILHHFDRKNRNSAFILIINRNAFEDTFAKNYQKFILKYGSDITAEKMLQKCLGEESLFAADVIHCHELQGILFGFGRHNSKLFQEREDLGKLAELHRLGLRIPSRAFLEEIDQINSKLQFFGDDDSSVLRLTSLPTFAADLNHVETVALRKKYKMQRRRVAKHYRNGNFLELTLQQFSHPHTGDVP